MQRFCPLNVLPFKCFQVFRPYLPIVVIGSKNNAGAGVCVASYPGTVHSKHHQQHQHQHSNDVFDIGTQPLLRFLLFRYMFSHFACLNKHKYICYGKFYHPWQQNSCLSLLHTCPINVYGCPSGCYKGRPSCSID